MNQCSSGASATPVADGPWVVVVEEDPVVQCLIASVLRDAGYRVHTSSAVHATELAPALLIVGTLSQSQQAHARAMHPGVPLLALSESAAREADGYLAAPFAAADLLDAVRVLLALASAPELDPDDTLVDVGAALEVALRLASSELAACAHVTCEFDSRLRVRANPEQLCLLFLQLLRSAARRINRESAETNGILVAGWRTAEGRTVVEISDSGRNISAERLTHLFDARVEGEAPLRGGLDLCASQQRVRAGGGAITVTSHAGGSRVRVELPTAAA
ncbi:MAG: ATP-binding protein [Polyangiales bacterium]